MPIKTIIVGPIQTNCYLYYSKKTLETIIIDPGEEAKKIIKEIKSLKLKPKKILLTHGHYDHHLAAKELQNHFNIPALINSNDKQIFQDSNSMLVMYGKEERILAKPLLKLDEKYKSPIKDLEFQIMKTPGHTPGGVVIHSKKDKIAFVGDTIFAHGGVGRTDLKGGDYSKLKNSIEKILSLPNETILYPGHGPKTTVLDEKKYH